MAVGKPKKGAAEVHEHAPERQHAGHIGHKPASILDNLQARHLALLATAEIDLGIGALVEGFAPVADRVIHPNPSFLFGARRHISEGHVRRIVPRGLAG